SDTRGLGTDGALTSGFAPQAVSDPNNPNTIVVVNANGANIAGHISRDGGQTWAAFGVPNNIFMSGVQLTNANSPPIAISRTGQFYVAYTMTTADFTTAGELLAVSFTLPATGTPTVLNGPVIIYQWLGQDPVYNPTIAVDNNVDQFTDPDTNNTTPQDT